FPIISLPLEIFSAILDYLSLQDLLSLYAVSKSFQRLITPRVFSHISFNLSEGDVYSKLLFLKSISTSSSIIAPAVKTLRIDSLKIFQKDQVTDPVREIISQTHEGEIGLDKEAVQAIVLDHLMLCLTKLQNLETVNWTYQPERDSSSCLFPITCRLSSLPKLKNVIISVDSSCTIDFGKHQLPPLRCFENLVSLTLSYSGDIPRAYCDREIAPVIAASPELTRFSLNNFCYSMYGRETKTCASLQSLLGKSRPELVQLKLARVPLPTAGLTQTLSCKLQELSVTTPTGSRDLDFSWAELWLTLKEIRVELSTLSVHGSEKAMDDMFAYLVSYTGLRKFVILGIRMDRQDLEDSVGRRLWHQIVPHHKDSLTELAVIPCYEGVWCYGPIAAETIPQCLSLRSLTLSVCSVDSSWADAKLSQARENDKVEFHSLEEPYGAPENCGALILCDLTTPLSKLTLNPTGNATDREVDIGHLDRRTRPKGSPQLYQALRRKERIRSAIDEVLLGMQASAAASKNWPSVVQASDSRLLKRRSKNDDNRPRYQIGPPVWVDSGCESDGNGESDE
ncbi:hypothetical protein Egran_00052, partial [Elaphomyces granulatus]